MKTIKLALGIAVLVISATTSFAQTFSTEKTVELTGKSKNKGYLGNVVTDDSKKQFDMIFVTKSTNRKIKFDVYKFDYDLNLVSTTPDEQEVKNARTKYKWFKYNGDGENDEVTYEGITADKTTYGNKLVLKKIQTIKKFNWWRGQYEYETKQLEKVKPTTLDEDGKKRQLMYNAHQEISSSGELLVLALENPGMMNLMKSGTRNYLLLRYNKDLQVAEENSLPFTTPQSLVFTGTVEGSDANGDADVVYVFAPYGGSGYGKIQDPLPTNFTYVRVAPGGKIIDRFNFTSKCNQWAVMDIVQKGNDVFIYGPGNQDKPEKNYSEFNINTSGAVPSGGTAEQREMVWQDKKYDFLQIMKVSSGKLSFLNAVSIEEINAKAVKPPEQKKMYEFDGKRFVLSSINITGSGDIFIDGQDFRVAKENGGGRVYKDLLMFHFDKDGSFKRFYGIENTAKSRLRPIANAKAYPSKSSLSESPDHKSLLWNIFLVKDIDEDCSSSSNGITKTTTCYYTPLFQGRMGKIDIATGSVSDFKLYGGEDFYLYMDLENDKGNKEPYFTINGGTQSIYLARERKGGFTGTERWGNAIWFGKLDPSK